MELGELMSERRAERLYLLKSCCSSTSILSAEAGRLGLEDRNGKVSRSEEVLY